MKKGEIKVSVICITYNQKQYIRKAVDSVLSQITDFDYEIIIHDDASTDGTEKIVMEYEERRPDLVKAFYEQENQYSKYRDFMAEIIKNKASGQYIAFCEGDDYWIDDRKLQFQYDALEEHGDCDMCGCCGSVVSEDGLTEIHTIRPQNHDRILSAKDVIMGGGQYLVTSGLFFRKSMYDTMFPFERIIPLDYAQQIKGALRGGIYYIDRKMAAYRKYSNGSWTNNVLRNTSRLRLQWEKEVAFLKQLNIDTNGVYNTIIDERLKAYVSFEEQIENHRDEVLSVLQDISGKKYIWGRGRRGSSLENFFNREAIVIDGICDAINTEIGNKTESGNVIFHTDFVMQNANVIFASNKYAYDDLKKTYKGILINFQDFMPLG